MNKLDLQTKKVISKDWNQHFNWLSIYKPMWLMKRHGPLLIGICLERDSSNENYLPIIHIHNLCSSKGFISLTLANSLMDTRNYYFQRIKVKNHSLEFLDAAQRLEKQSFFSINKESLSLSEVLKAYQEFINSSMSNSAYLPFLYIDIVSLLVWCGKFEDAKTHATKYLKELELCDYSYLEFVGGYQKLSNDLLEIIECPDIQKTQCENEAKLLKVETLNDYGLICD